VLHRGTLRHAPPTTILPLHRAQKLLPTFLSLSTVLTVRREASVLHRTRPIAYVPFRFCPFPAAARAYTDELHEPMSLHSPKQQGDVELKSHVASIYFKCFRGMLQVFLMDVAKVD
jgi:hypothetical protein